MTNIGHVVWLEVKPERDAAAERESHGAKDRCFVARVGGGVALLEHSDASPVRPSVIEAMWD
jgi:hypothetical protein